MFISAWPCDELDRQLEQFPTPYGMLTVAHSALPLEGGVSYNGHYTLPRVTLSVSPPLRGQVSPVAMGKALIGSPIFLWKVILNVKTPQLQQVLALFGKMAKRVLQWTVSEVSSAFSRNLTERFVMWIMTKKISKIILSHFTALTLPTVTL